MHLILLPFLESSRGRCTVPCLFGLDGMKRPRQTRDLRYTHTDHKSPSPWVPRVVIPEKWRVPWDVDRRQDDGRQWLRCLCEGRDGERKSVSTRSDPSEKGRMSGWNRRLSGTITRQDSSDPLSRCLWFRPGFGRVGFESRRVTSVKRLDNPARPHCTTDITLPWLLGSVGRYIL